MFDVGLGHPRPVSAMWSASPSSGQRSLPEAFSWALSEHPRQFELGHILNSAVADVLVPGPVGALGVHHAGLWECDLRDNSLIWSGGSYDIFGLPRGCTITREQAVSQYCEHSRARLEALRGHAIRHKQGFTLDVEIREAAAGHLRWMRIIGAPVCDGGAVVRVHGLKLII